MDEHKESGREGAQLPVFGRMGECCLEELMFKLKPEEKKEVNHVKEGAQ